MTPLDGFRLRQFSWNHSFNPCGSTRSRGIKRHQSHYRNTKEAFDGSLRNWKTSSCLAEFFYRRQPKTFNFMFSVTNQLQYLRPETSDGITHIKDLTAKTRVALIERICVPCMELCAALLGSKLGEATLATISDIRFILPNVFAWTDSQVTIACLREVPRKWKTFVANR